MAKKVKKKSIHKNKKSTSTISPFKIYWQKENYYILIIGMLVIIVGFFLMSRGTWDSIPALVLSPIVLIIGYVFIFPAAIFYKKKKRDSVTQGEKVDSGQS